MFEAMRELIRLFAGHCDDRSTLDELARILSDRKLWITAYELFQAIRRKSIAAEQNGDARLIAQYDFEEICAKALYNCGAYLKGDLQDAFKPDVAFFIVPRALILSRSLDLEDTAALDIATRF